MIDYCPYHGFKEISDNEEEEKNKRYIITSTGTISVSKIFAQEYFREEHADASGLNHRMLLSLFTNKWAKLSGLNELLQLQKIFNNPFIRMLLRQNKLNAYFRPCLSAVFEDQFYETRYEQDSHLFDIKVTDRYYYDLLRDHLREDGDRYVSFAKKFVTKNASHDDLVKILLFVDALYFDEN